MERNYRVGVTPSRHRMNTLERARAEEGMHQAMLLGNLTLKGVARVRNALNGVRHAIFMAFDRSLG